MKDNKILNLYDRVLIAGVILSNLIYSLISVYTNGEPFDTLGFIAGITGVLLSLIHI